MKAFVRFFTAVAILVASLSGAFALDVPTLTGRVVDNAKVLTAPQHQEIDGLLKTIEEKTTAQVVILTVPKLDGDDIADFTQKVFRSWKLGQADKNNGVLLVFAIEERRVRVQPGYGLEGVIPDGEAWSIIRKVIAPHLDKKKNNDDYHAAFKDAVIHIGQLIEGERQPGDKPLSSTNNVNEGVLIVFLIILMVSGFVGMVHNFAGGVVGGLGSGLAAYIIFGTTAGFFGLVAGFLIGLIARYIVDIGLQIGLGGLAGGFSGGGGDSGGAGSSGDF